MNGDRSDFTSIGSLRQSSRREVRFAACETDRLPVHRRLQVIVEIVDSAHGAELCERLLLDLSDSLARDPE